MNETNNGQLYHVDQKFYTELKTFATPHGIQIIHTTEQYIDSSFNKDILNIYIKLAGATRPLKRVGSDVVFYKVKFWLGDVIKVLDLERIDVESYLDMYIDNKTLK